MARESKTEYVSGYQKPILRLLDPITREKPREDQQNADADIDKKTRPYGVGVDDHSHDDRKHNERHEKTCGNPKSHDVLFVDLFFVLVKCV
jgi:hypothetical protein